ncbi:chemotaxis-specific protein-glutamate methyltransferase CheB [Heliobacterium gestii]|uniref:Protein-glutamate methylesterase/protein-glutamine glutaminase n=1 Tax=Heliomicrobium gestii TaxID=2699 RepID=A0A845LB94_HELGE|nr:chemotaxis response regulator protein-glutamate methylesterase [Heliomicrobium gestii]MBM7867128.1 two-component system chemotaxis response regulator CheB [Heliomicrobium gestii]MZP43458.1 chemotaxis-specific protein-glutamate methyltransferase CheB [Heliomicrobium gestii]
MPQIKVLVVDDSAFMRKVITDMIVAEPGMVVVGTARNGQDALEKIAQLSPDVVTLDVEMPVMDGLTTLERIMASRPMPVVMLSSLTQQGADATMQALQKGAVDFIPKPSGSISLDIHKVRQELIGKLKVAAIAKVRPRVVDYRPLKSPFSPPSATSTPSAQPTPAVAPAVPPVARAKILPGLGTQRLNKLVLLGTSTGGPKALYEVIPKLPADLGAAVLIVQHMPPGFTRSLAERLDAASALKVKEAQDGEEIQTGVVYIAPGDYHFKVAVVEQPGTGRQMRVKLTQEPPVGGHRPAVDVMMLSAAQQFWSPMVGVILTGMGGDGTEGMKLIKSRQGRTIAEDASTCVVFGMPKVAIESGCVDKVVPLNGVADEIVKLLQDR